MDFDLRDKLLKSLIQGHSPRAKDQIVQVLSVFWFDGKAGINVLINEHIIKYRHVRETCGFHALSWNIAAGGPPLQSRTTCGGC